MEKLNVKETAKLDFRYREKSAFDTEIRRVFEKLNVGESIVFTLREWQECYKNPPQPYIYGWIQRRKWEGGVKKLKVGRSRDTLDITYAIVRTK